MQITILKTTKAASCKLGIKVKEYLSGETVEIFDELAQVFIKQGWGIKFEEPEAIEYIIEEKSIEKSPENKAIEKAPDNKSFIDKASKKIKKNIKTKK